MCHQPSVSFQAPIHLQLSLLIHKNEIAVCFPYSVLSTSPCIDTLPMPSWPLKPQSPPSSAERFDGYGCFSLPLLPFSRVMSSSVASRPGLQFQSRRLTPLSFRTPSKSL